MSANFVVNSNSTTSTSTATFPFTSKSNSTSPFPLRLAILDTASVPLPQAHAKYGAWSAISTKHLLAGADALGLSRDRLQISRWDVINGYGDQLGGDYPALEDVDVLLITGSREFCLLIIYSPVGGLELYFLYGFAAPQCFCHM